MGASQPAHAITVELNLLYIHGLKSCQSSRLNAETSLDELMTAIAATLPAEIAAYEASHPGVSVVVNSAHANLYTATPSGIHPSDSPDPLNMDDWEVGDPGCSTSVQGEPCTTAYEWRFRLAQEIDRLYPPPARNIVPIGHSAGARVSMEVAANVGPSGVGTQDWGVSDRIAGVVTVQGLVDEIGSSKYNVVGFTSFESACKSGDPIAGFGDSCAPGNGFCEYAARIGGFAPADWVARNKRALMLTAWGSCSPSAWTGRSDGVLPYDAQASPWALGLDMTPAPGETWREVHGQRYGAFCHSAITNGSDSQHPAARDAARTRILDWLFVAAPRTAVKGTNTTPSIGFNQSTGNFSMSGGCPAGDVDDTLTQGTKGPGIDVVGVCRHPGFFDGDDHAIVMSEFTVTNGASCDGSYRWTQAHDSSNNHAASFWWKTRSLSANGPALVDMMVAEALAECGNGALDPGEACDDANTDDGDCCSSTCELDPAGSTCPGDGNPCTDDVCDAAGSCGIDNSAPCDDGLFCNGDDWCTGGACSVHAGDPCASEGECNDWCEEASASCAVPAGEPCTDDGNPCTDDTCDGAGACAHTPNAAACDDGQFCNGTDTCSGGSCSVHAGDPCLDEVECAGVCDELGDLCLAPPGVACSDDGNPCTDDACDGAGACAHVPNDDSCDDGDACTLDDRCQDGVCTGGVAVECGACESCDVAVGCVLRPRPMCKATGAGNSRLRIRNGSPDSRDLVQWKWQRGAATAISELGAPASSDDYTLCIYGDPDAAAAESLLVATAPAAKQCNGRSCWKVGSSGLKYKDRERTPHGLTSIRVVPGADGRARVIVKGKAEHLSDRDGGLAPLPFSLPLTVQLQVDDGICWTARYQAATTNGVDALKARSE